MQKPIHTISFSQQHRDSQSCKSCPAVPAFRVPERETAAWTLPDSPSSTRCRYGTSMALLATIGEQGIILKHLRSGSGLLYVRKDIRHVPLPVRFYILCSNIYWRIYHIYWGPRSALTYFYSFTVQNIFFLAFKSVSLFLVIYFLKTFDLESHI